MPQRFFGLEVDTAKAERMAGVVTLHRVLACRSLKNSKFQNGKRSAQLQLMQVVATVCFPPLPPKYGYCSLGHYELQAAIKRTATQSCREEF